MYQLSGLILLQVCLQSSMVIFWQRHLLFSWRKVHFHIKWQDSSFRGWKCLWRALCWGCEKQNTNPKPDCEYRTEQRNYPAFQLKLKKLVMYSENIYCDPSIYFNQLYSPTKKLLINSLDKVQTSNHLHDLTNPTWILLPHVKALLLLPVVWVPESRALLFGWICINYWRLDSQMLEQLCQMPT